MLSEINLPSLEARSYIILIPFITYKYWSGPKKFSPDSQVPHIRILENVKKTLS